METSEKSTTKNPEIKEYADGWISEREGTDAPIFLKIAFVIIGLSTVAYLFIYMNGDVNNSDHGPLVRSINAATVPADTLMTIVGVMMLIYVAVVAVFAFRKMH